MGHHARRRRCGLDPFPGTQPAPLLFGAVAYRDYGRQMEWFNNAFLRRADGSIGGRYDKIVLMPFGEVHSVLRHVSLRSRR